MKTLVISEIIHFPSVTVLPNSRITQLNKIDKEFIWNHETPKIKEKTLINNFEKGALKDADIPYKKTVCNLHTLFDTNFDEWKIIPLFLIEKYFGKNFMDPLMFPNIFLNWSKFLFCDASVPSTMTILSQYLWFNKHIKIQNNSVYFILIFK